MPLQLIADPTEQLLHSDEPWVRYKALSTLGERADDPEVIHARREMITNPAFRGIIDECVGWPGKPVTRHNDATLLMHKLAFLADWGVDATDEGVKEVSRDILSGTSREGALQSLIHVPESYGGSGAPGMDWMLCDASLLLYSILSFGLSGEPVVAAAVEHLIRSISSNGWRCLNSIPRFRGPGRKEDHCPYANLLSLKALSLVQALHGSDEVKVGVEAQLSHWEKRRERKYYLFGISTDFLKLKYPHVWYDVLHVLDVLSRFQWIRRDDRLLEMWGSVASKQRDDRLFVPESVWMAWKGWSFAQKREPSPSLTLRVALIAKRLGAIH